MKCLDKKTKTTIFSIDSFFGLRVWNWRFEPKSNRSLINIFFSIWLSNLIYFSIIIHKCTVNKTSITLCAYWKCKWQYIFVIIKWQKCKNNLYCMWSSPNSSSLFYSMNWSVQHVSATEMWCQIRWLGMFFYFCIYWEHKIAINYYLLFF